MLASAGLDNVVRVWDVATRKEVAELTGHQRRIHFVTFSHNGLQLATAGMDRTVKLWNTPRLTQAPTLESSQISREGAGGRGVRTACSAEAEKLCNGEERVGRCLRAHMDQLSPDCKAALGPGRGNR